MNVLHLNIVSKFQEISYLFLEKKIPPALFSSAILSAIEAIPEGSNCTSFYKIKNFAYKIEEICELNELEVYFQTYKSKENGWPYFNLMKIELLNFLNSLFKKTKIEKCTKKLQYDFPFLSEVKLLCVSFLDQKITNENLLQQIEYLYKNWREEISPESFAVIRYFLSAIRIIPFVNTLNATLTTNKIINQLINYIGSIKTF